MSIQEHCQVLGYSLELIRSDKRTRNLVEARRLIALDLYKQGLNQQTIGKTIKRDRSQVSRYITAC